MKRSVATLACCAGAVLGTWAPAADPARDAAPAGPRAVVSVEAAGFLQFGPALEAEVAAGRNVGVAAAVREMRWGAAAAAAARARDHRMLRGTLAGVAARFYRGADGRLAGWYAGPRFEIGSVVTDQADTYAAMLTAEAGHRWIRGGWAWSAGAQAGAAAGWYKGRTPADPATQYYPVGQVALSAGRAF
jgi:hypothetical protein